MENYIKTVLYAYPLLKNVEVEYAEHIKNKAILSYDSRWDAEKLTEYLAEEILSKNHLIWLRQLIERVVARLNEVERVLLSIRYFGQTRCAQVFKEQSKEIGALAWSERTYFRKQQRLGEKVAAMLCVDGLTRDVFDRDFAHLDIIGRIHKFVEEGRDRKIAADETRWLHGRE